MNPSLTVPPTLVTLPTFQVLDEGPCTSAVLNRFQQWLLDGGYARTNVATYVTNARWLLSLLPHPGMLDASPDVVIHQLGFAMEQHGGLSRSMKQTAYLILKKLQEFLYFERGLEPPTADPLALPARLTELPEWLREPVGRHLRLKQRNWPATTVRQQTQNLFGGLRQICQFFLQQYAWTDWQQLSVRWVDAYIETSLRHGLAPSTINWVLSAWHGFCRFLCEEGYAVPAAMTRLQSLDVPHRLPRPLPDAQVRQLEQTIQKANLPQAVFDLAWFYLLWHCGLRVGEIHRLKVNDLDLTGHKLWVRMSKRRKDRVVYLSDTAVQALHDHLRRRPDRDAVYVFTRYRHPLSTRAIQRRLAAYGRQVGVDVTPHRLRHTFASQMLAAGMPVTSLQRYLGHDNISMTMLYAEVSDPMLQQDYYRGITTLDPNSAKLSTEKISLPRDELRQLVTELGAVEQTSPRYSVTLQRLQQLLTPSEGGTASDP